MRRSRAAGFIFLIAAAFASGFPRRVEARYNLDSLGTPEDTAPPLRKVKKKAARAPSKAVSTKLGALPDAPADASGIPAPHSWTGSVELDSTYGSYAMQTSRDIFRSASAFGQFQYLEKFGWRVGGRSVYVGNKKPIADITQSEAMARLYKNFNLDRFPGTFTASIDGTSIANNDPTRATDNVAVIGGKLSFLTYGQGFSLAVGGAHSNYRQGLYVDQWTPSVGGLLGPRTWLELQGIFIRPSNPSPALGQSQTKAGQIKISRWFLKRGLFWSDAFHGSAAFGERVYEVDQEAMSVSNLSDLHKWGYSGGFEWRLASWCSALAISGYDSYANLAANQRYALRYLYGKIQFSF